jgi:hypothetical protein
VQLLRRVHQQLLLQVLTRSASASLKGLLLRSSRCVEIQLCSAIAPASRLSRARRRCVVVVCCFIAARSSLVCALLLWPCFPEESGPGLGPITVGVSVLPRTQESAGVKTSVVTVGDDAVTASASGASAAGSATAAAASELQPAIKPAKVRRLSRSPILTRCCSAVDACRLNACRCRSTSSHWIPSSASQ